MLWLLLKDAPYEVIELHTTISSVNDRVSMHGVHRSLLQAQANSLGLQIRFLPIAPSATNEQYEKALSSYYKELAERGIDQVAFGDIFLEDLKNYRDRFLKKHELSGIYPLWQRSTSELVKRFIDEGFKTIVCAAFKEKFPSSITGKYLDHSFLHDLPEDVDPCGENGEFHTFAFDGPLFKKPIQFSIGKKVEKVYKNHEKESTFEFVTLNLIS